MSLKFGRTYILYVLGRSGAMIPLFFPLTLKFDISHATFSGANNMRLQIYNLSPANQKEIYWDQWIKASPIPTTLYAGYDSTPNIPQIFTGNVTVAYTERSGPDLITHIEAYDGGFGIRNGVISYPVPANTSLKDTFTQAVRLGLPGVTPGEVVVSNPPPVNTSQQILNGSTWQEIHEKLVPPGGQCFIADGVANLVGLNDYLPTTSFLGVLDSGSGLLGIPKREGQIVTCSCIFEPRMKLSQIVELTSIFAPWVNGKYQIVGFKHHGTISGVESGDAITDITLFSKDAPRYPTVQGPTGPAVNFSSAGGLIA